MKTILIVVLLVMVSISCSTPQNDDKTTSLMLDELNNKLTIHYKNDSIIRLQDFEYGYRLAYYNMLKGRFDSYVEFEKQWSLDSTKRVNGIKIEL
jgi:uncharacterized lipoprotein YehR (DUF1307 family)